MAKWKRRNHSPEFKAKVALGGCPRIDNLLRNSLVESKSLILLVKYAQYSPQTINNFDSTRLSLATVAILGQPPSH